MRYCPDCGGEILTDDAGYCYRCGNRLKELALDEADVVKSFQKAIALQLDAEIANVTAPISDELPEQAENATGAHPRVEEVIDQITSHTIGYGKGLVKATLVDVEAGDNDVEYDDVYAAMYQWVKETVDSREEYIKDALQPSAKE